MELKHIIQLPEDSDDAPTFKNLHPQYDVLVYGEDGVKLTAKERRLLHLYEDDGDVTLLPDLEPAEIVAPLSSRFNTLPGNNPYSAFLAGSVVNACGTVRAVMKGAGNIHLLCIPSILRPGTGPSACHVHTVMSA